MLEPVPFSVRNKYDIKSKILPKMNANDLARIMAALEIEGDPTEEDVDKMRQKIQQFIERTRHEQLTERYGIDPTYIVTNNDRNSLIRIANKLGIKVRVNASVHSLQIAILEALGAADLIRQSKEKLPKRPHKFRGMNVLKSDGKLPAWYIKETLRKLISSDDKSISKAQLESHLSEKAKLYLDAILFHNRKLEQRAGTVLRDLATYAELAPAMFIKLAKAELAKMPPETIVTEEMFQQIKSTLMDTIQQKITYLLQMLDGGPSLEHYGYQRLLVDQEKEVYTLT